MFVFMAFSPEQPYLNQHYIVSFLILGDRSWLLTFKAIMGPGVLSCKLSFASRRLSGLGVSDNVGFLAQGFRRKWSSEPWGVEWLSNAFLGTWGPLQATLISQAHLKISKPIGHFFFPLSGRKACLFKCGEWHLEMWKEVFREQFGVCVEHLPFCIFLLLLFILCLIQILISIHLPDLLRQGFRESHSPPQG